MSTKLNGTTTEVAAAPRAPGEPGKSAIRPGDGFVPRRRGEEYFDTILWRLRGRMEACQDGGYLVGLTGCQRRSGASTVAANLAIRAADQGVTPALLVDANFHFPRQRKLLAARKGPGLAEVLTGRCAVAEAIQSTKVVGLNLLPMGSREVLARSAVDCDRLEALLKELRQDYRLVVFDLSSADDLHHGLLIATALDAALIVVRAEGARRRTVELAANRLLADGVNLVGSVMTGHKQYTPGWLRRLI